MSLFIFLAFFVKERFQNVKKDLGSAFVIMGIPCEEKGYQTRLTSKALYKEKNWYFCVESEKEKLPPKD
jgi:hypothetical protein